MFQKRRFRSNQRSRALLTIKVWKTTRIETFDDRIHNV